MDTTLDPAASSHRVRGAQRPELVLVLLWSVDDPARAGEVLRLAPGPRGSPCIFGRGEAPKGETRPRIELRRERPGSVASTGPVDNRFLSRVQLELSHGPDGLNVANVGRCPMVLDGQSVSELVMKAGDIFELRGHMVFLCVERTPSIAALRHYPEQRLAPFGQVDAHGLVGESPAAWALRDRVAFVAARGAHVLLLGESGTGKELVAQAIHALSTRCEHALVVRNAATFPPGLIDAELFGNVKNYPNPGMPERPGIVGEADGSTLFLDEIGELPIDMQTHLLRVLDPGGDYQRLGEARRRKADVRLVAATNRPVDQLKHDLAARLPLRVIVPGLNQRAEDIPLLVRHLLGGMAAGDSDMRRFCASEGGGEARVALALIQELVRHRYTTHVRELQRLLWLAVATSEDDRVELTDAVRAEIAVAPSKDEESRPAREVTAQAIRESLERHAGVREKVWRELGLANRHVLKRLLKKYGITTGAGDDTAEDSDA